jgi:hypothetical protein
VKLQGSAGHARGAAEVSLDPYALLVGSAECSAPAAGV